MVSKFISSIIIFIFSSCSLLIYRGGTISELRKVEFVSQELDGTVTVISLGNGRNRMDAVTQAKKNAIYSLLFKGINSNQNEYILRPLVPEVNAEVKYKDYFNLFFKDNGEYEKYVTNTDEPFLKRIKRYEGKSQNEKYFSSILRIDLPSLEKKLKQDNIIK